MGQSRFATICGWQVYIFATPPKGARTYHFHILTVTEETLHLAALFAWLAHAFSLPLQRPAL